MNRLIRTGAKMESSGRLKAVMKRAGACALIIVAATTSCVSVRPPAEQAAEEATFSAGAAEVQITTTRDRDKISPFKHTIVLGYCNGGWAYVATAADYELGARGGYEASPYDIALGNNHGLAFDPAAEQIIRDGIVELLDKLKQD